MALQKILFIINPFSGLGRKKKVPILIQQQLDTKKFSYEIAYTEYAGHATELAAAAVKNGYNVVVAVGGDGSVNEVAAALIDTEVKLGILPGGSGNGFAMHLGLGRNIKTAIALLNEAQPFKIDTCLLNNRPFVNLAGTGFDALVSYKVKTSALRGLWGYVKFAALEAWSYPMQQYQIIIDGQEVLNEFGLVVEVANAQMFGYNFVIAPQAKLNDGILDVLFVKKVPKWRYLFSLWRFFNQTSHKSSLVKVFKGKNIQIISPEIMPVHVDGEGYYLEKELNFQIQPSSLEVLVPREFV